jgi:RHS repeat-associated protein
LLWVNNYQTTFDGQTLPTGIHFVAYDGNGNVSALVKASDGSVSARYEYGPFAEPVRVTGPLADAQPIRFSTKWTDLESGFLYYGYRYYNPSTGRWLSRDPIEEDGGPDLYDFVGNDPLQRVDVDGRWYVVVWRCTFVPPPIVLSNGIRCFYVCSVWKKIGPSRLFSPTTTTARFIPFPQSCDWYYPVVCPPVVYEVEGSLKR